MSEQTLELASRGKRLGGSLLDSLIASVVIVPVMIFMGAFKQASQGQKMGIEQTIAVFLLGNIVFLVINGIFLAKHGQTLGKKIVGTRIVSESDRQILPLTRVFGLRYLPVSVIAQIPLAGSFFSLANALFIFRSDKRCIHDLIAGTIVVDTKHVPPRPVEPPSLPPVV